MKNYNNMMQESAVSSCIYKNIYIFQEDLQNYNEELEEDETIEPPYLPMMFEYLVDSFPHENFKHFMECLEKCKILNRI